ncbi:MAG: transposase, partial [Bacteroidota bacterium]
AFEQTLETVNGQVGLLEGELDSLSDEEHERQVAKITSLVGIGAKTARALLCATGGLGTFEHDRQLAKFIGIVPSSHDSGSSVRYKGPITKKGNSELRACLYMAARSARRFNLACRELYERLRSRGKCHKQAMVAVMNKLIRQVFAIVKNDTVFDNRHYLKYINR